MAAPNPEPDILPLLEAMRHVGQTLADTGGALATLGQSWEIAGQELLSQVTAFEVQAQQP